MSVRPAVRLKSFFQRDGGCSVETEFQQNSRRTLHLALLRLEPITFVEQSGPYGG